MSRIGKKPIPLPSNVEIDIKPGQITVKGPKGELVQQISTDMKVETADGEVTVTRPTDRGPHRALHAGVDADTRPGVAVMSKGVWLRNHSDGWGVNTLTPATGDALINGACFNDTVVQVAPAT